MSGYAYRLIDTSGSEIGIVRDERERVEEGHAVTLPDGTIGTVLEVYDDEAGRDEGVQATLVVDES